MYANLSRSYQWNMMNQNNAITTRVVEVIKEGEVPPDMLTTTLKTIQNRVRSPIFQQLITAINDGSIIMLFSERVTIYCIAGGKQETYRCCIFKPLRMR